MSEKNLHFIKQLLFCHSDRESMREKEQFGLALTCLFDEHLLPELKADDRKLTIMVSSPVELSSWDSEMKRTIKKFLAKNKIDLYADDEQELFLKYLDYTE